jgi:hypothetical protein
VDQLPQLNEYYSTLQILCWEQAGTKAGNIIKCWFLDPPFEATADQKDLLLADAQAATKMLMQDLQ